MSALGGLSEAHPSTWVCDRTEPSGKLHLEHPLELIGDLVEDVGDAVAGLRDVQIAVCEEARVVLVRPEQVEDRRRHGPPDILVVVAGIVPAAGEIERAVVGVTARRGGRRVADVTGGLIGPRTGVRRRFGGVATLEVEGPQRRAQGVAIDLRADLEVVGLGGQGGAVDPVDPRRFERREIDPPHRVARRRPVVALEGDRSTVAGHAEDHHVTAVPDLDRRTRIGAEDGDLGVCRAVAEVVQLDVRGSQVPLRARSLPTRPRRSRSTRDECLVSRTSRSPDERKRSMAGPLSQPEPAVPGAAGHTDRKPTHAPRSLPNPGPLGTHVVLTAVPGKGTVGRELVRVLRQRRKSLKLPAQHPAAQEERFSTRRPRPFR